MRLIDGDILMDEYVDRLVKVSERYGIDSSEAGILSGAMKLLDSQPSAQPEIIRCKDCKYFYYDHPYIIQGIPVLGHLVCTKWGDGCRTVKDGFCFMAERRTDETD